MTGAKHDWSSGILACRDESLWIRSRFCDIAGRTPLRVVASRMLALQSAIAARL